MFQAVESHAGDLERGFTRDRFASNSSSSGRADSIDAVNIFTIDVTSRTSREGAA